MKTIVITDELLKATKAFKNAFPLTPEDTERHKQSSDSGDLSFLNAIAWVVGQLSEAVILSEESEL